MALGFLLSALSYLIVGTMNVGILTVILSVPNSNSLKDKRQVVKSLLDNVRNRFNISAAEIARLDSHRVAELGFACVSNDKAVINSVLDKVIDFIESNPLCEITDSQIEFV